MLKLSSLKVDIAKERDGDWVTYQPRDWPEAAQFKVRSINSPQYLEAYQALTRRFTKRYGDKAIPPDELTADLGKVYGDHLLLDWKNIDPPYSREAAEEALCDPANRPLVEAVLWCAARVGSADAEFTKAAEKN